MTGFWKNWMQAWCVGVVLFGVVLATAAFAHMDGLAAALFKLLSGGRTDASVFQAGDMRFVTGLMGCVTLGWGLTLLAIARDGGNSAIWRLTMAGLVIWYVIDSFVSISTGWPLNAVSNTLLLLLFLVPVLASGILKR